MLAISVSRWQELANEPIPNSVGYIELVLLTSGLNRPVVIDRISQNFNRS